MIESDAFMILQVLQGATTILLVVCMSIHSRVNPHFGRRTSTLVV